MRLLALIPSFYGRTGEAVNERQFITALASKVDKCCVITFVGFKQVFTRRRDELKVSLPENMTIIPLPIPEIHMLAVYSIMIVVSCIMGLIGLMLNALQNVDLIYVRGSFLSIGFLTFRSLAKKTIVKIPAILEDEMPNADVARFFIGEAAHFMDRLVLARAKKVAVSSTVFYEELVKRCSFRHEDEPMTLTACLNLQLAQKVKRQIHNELGNNPSVGFIGSLSWWQGAVTLAQAVILLKKKVSNLRLVIIGDGESRRFIEALCKSSSISYEMTGSLPHEEALEHLGMLDILVLPRKRTPTTESIIPIKVMEAWALGVPVIVTKHRVFLDNQIKNYEDVIYCEPEPNSVANAICLLLNNHELRKKLETNGPKLAKRFDCNKIAENLLKA